MRTKCSINTRYRKVVSERSVASKAEKNRKNSEPETSYNLCECDNCSEIFPNQDALLMHYCTKKRKKMSEETNDFKKHSTADSAKEDLRSCVVCHEKFQSSVDLKCHLAKHAGRMVYTCNVCKQTFKTNIKWKDHIQQSINASHCEECGQHFGCLTANNRHKCIKLAYVCFECGLKFTKRWTLDRHLHGHKLENTCPMCNKKFFRKDFYKKHIRTCKHVVNIKQRSLSIIADSKSDMECTLQNDNRISSNDEKCNEETKNPDLVISENDEPIVPFQDETISLKSELSSTFGSLNETISSQQTADPPVIAQALDNIDYKQKDDVENELPVIDFLETSGHDDELKFVRDDSIEKKNEDGLHACNECNKVFLSPRAIHIHHTVVHKKKLPFRKEGLHNINLSGSVREHRNLSIVGPRDLEGQPRNSERRRAIFRCRKCSKIFRNAKLLESHENVHKLLSRQLTCRKCGATFLNKAQLRDHYRTHGKKKKYICCVCNLESISVMDLRLHRATHYGCICSPTLKKKNKLTFKCYQCNKLYTFKKFEIHYRKHTSYDMTPGNNNNTIHTSSNEEKIESSLTEESVVETLDPDIELKINNPEENSSEDMIKNDVCLSLSSELEINQDMFSAGDKNSVRKELRINSNVPLETDMKNDKLPEVNDVDILGRISDLVKQVYEPFEDACLPEEAKEKREDNKELQDEHLKQPQEIDESHTSTVTNRISSAENKVLSCLKRKVVSDCDICYKIFHCLPQQFQEICSSVLRRFPSDENPVSLNGNFATYNCFIPHMYHIGLTRILKDGYVYCCPECKESNAALNSILNHVCSSSGICIIKEKINKFNCDNSTFNQDEKLNPDICEGDSCSDIMRNTDEVNFENVKQVITFLFDNLIQNDNSKEFTEAGNTGTVDTSRSNISEMSAVRDAKESSYEAEKIENTVLTKNIDNSGDKENACLSLLQQLEHSNLESSTENCIDIEKSANTNPNDSKFMSNSQNKSNGINCIFKKRKRRTLLKQKLAELKKLIDVGKITNENPHICNVCGKIFSKPQGILNHYFIKHEGQVGSNLDSSVKHKGDLAEEVLIKGNDEKEKINISETVIKNQSKEESFSTDLNSETSSKEVNSSEMITESVNKDTDPTSNSSELHELRENFSKLLCHLVGDKEVLTDFGWPKRLIDDVLVDVIKGCDHSPAVVSEKTTLENLRDNISILLRICVKEQAMENFGWNMKPVEEVVKEMLSGGEISDL